MRVKIIKKNNYVNVLLILKINQMKTNFIEY
ncbi:MAG: hypothetical protein HGGPFJEG_00823 [Ignavibacteria bacterium]|nr:hypothetical protein [Ignavibacteria bacterium]